MNIFKRQMIENVEQLYRKLMGNKQIKKVIESEEIKRILDVGIGSGVTAKVFQKRTKKHIEGLDIQNDLWEDNKDLIITLYDGKHFPYSKGSFDLILIFLVLHHCEDQEQLLIESKNTTSRYILILEELKTNIWSNILMTIYDWLINLIIFGHSIDLPDFLTESELEKMFKKVNLQIKTKLIYKQTFFVKRAIYLLEK